MGGGGEGGRDGNVTAKEAMSPGPPESDRPRGREKEKGREGGKDKGREEGGEERHIFPRGGRGHIPFEASGDPG